MPSKTICTTKPCSRKHITGVCICRTTSRDMSSSYFENYVMSQRAQVMSKVGDKKPSQLLCSQIGLINWGSEVCMLWRGVGCNDLLRSLLIPSIL